MDVRIEPTELDGVLVVRPARIEDERGFFSELFRSDVWAAAGLPSAFVQVNQSRSRRGVIRGLHVQWSPPQGKLMRVVQGAIYAVAVDVRAGSPTAGRWVGTTLDADEPAWVWAPPWFARGFQALSDLADVEYFTTAPYDPAGEAGIRWDDPAIGIGWPDPLDPLLSPKDGAAPSLAAWLERPEARFASG